MARMIDADALKIAIDNGWKPDMMVSEIWEIIDEQPTIEAEPVRHGHWIGYPECLAYEEAYCDENIVCSCCKSVWNIMDNDAERFDYCPACGAKMDEVSE